MFIVLGLVTHFQTDMLLVVIGGPKVESRAVGSSAP